MPFYSKTLRDVFNDGINYKQKLQIILQLCEGIKYYQSQKVIHRDLKPENILLNDDYSLVVADFGIAHFNDYSDLTKAEDWLANKCYAAPEQIKKKNALNVTAACDIFSLGRIINELFTGQNPIGVSHSTLFDVYPLLKPINDIVEKCLEQNPINRPDINDIIIELKLFIDEIEESVSIIKSRLYPTKKTCFNKEQEELLIETATYDIKMAEYIFETISYAETEKLNIDYHRNIHYKISEKLKNIYYMQKINYYCKKKFRYEAQAYTNGQTYCPLNMEKTNDAELFSKARDIIYHYGNNNEYKEIIGETLKIFASCCDYHCRELLSDMSHIEDNTDWMENAPILLIVKLFHSLSEYDLLNTIDLSDHISVNWNETVDSFTDDDTWKIVEFEDEKKILEIFQEMFHISYSLTAGRKFCIKFNQKRDYTDFRKFVLSNRKHDDYLILNLEIFLQKDRETDEIIELSPVYPYEIKYIVSDFLGLDEKGKKKRV